MKRKAMFVLISVLAVLTMVLAGCAVGAPTPSGQSGTVEVRVTDAPPNEEVTSVMVTVNSVEIHQAGNSASPTPTATATATPTPTQSPSESESGWLTVKLTGPTTFDLLKIKGLEQVLAVGDLAVGNYTQIRMEVTKVEVTFKGGQPEAAKLPSGKLKFVQPFDVAAGKTTVLLFDFDAAKSVKVTGNGQVMFKPVIKLNVTKTPGGMEITTSALPNGEIGVAYDAILAAMGGKTPYAWTIATGTLPAGLSLNTTTGAIKGNPTAAGDSTFTIKVEDNSPVKKSATKSFTVNIANAGVLQITTTSLSDGTINVDFSATVQAVGGTGAYTWSSTAGSLPGGLTLNATTGVISGTPTAQGDFNLTIKVADSATPTANIDTQNLTIHIVEEISP